MTTFESLILLAVTACVIITAFGVLEITQKLKELINRQYANWEQLRKIETNVEIISNNFLHLLDESKGLPALVDIVDKMHSNLCVEIADKVVDSVYPPTYVTPCYDPNGICMNPHGDCIDCPKRGDGGIWSTSTNKVKED